MRDKREKTFPGEYYHVFCRTVLGIPEFKDAKNADRLKLAFLIANSTVSDRAFLYVRNTKYPSIDGILEILSTGEKLVDVICYTIMPNHYHMSLCERSEGGIQSFIHKSNTSIAKYINIKNDRLGPLFESRYKVKHIDSNEYLTHVSRYIHLNILDIILGKQWRRGKLKDWDLIREKLISYPWSSLRFYIEREEDPILSGTNIVTSQFEGRGSYEKFLRSWAQDDFDFLGKNDPSTPGVDG